MKLKVLIADDHALLRQGLRQLLTDENPEFEFAEADGFKAVADVLAEGGIDLLLIDLDMPGMAGADSLKAVREAYPTTKVAVITGQDDRNTILECLGAGVHGYILKASAIQEIQRAINTILAGGVYVAPALTRVGVSAATAAREVVAAQQQGNPIPPGPDTTPHFTSRQLQVLKLLTEGRSTKDIARTLDLGPGTVKIHLAAIFRALHAHNRTEAVIRAAKLNL